LALPPGDPRFRAGSFTDPEYGSVGLAEAQARENYDCAVAVIRHDDLPRSAIDARAEGFRKLIVGRRSRNFLGAHVLANTPRKSFKSPPWPWLPICA